MQGRKCEPCQEQRVGYCPFDYECKFEDIENYRRKNLKAIAQEKLELAQRAG